MSITQNTSQNRVLITVHLSPDAVNNGIELTYSPPNKMVERYTFRTLVTHAHTHTHTHTVCVCACSLLDSVFPLHMFVWTRKELMLINFKFKTFRNEVIVSKWGALVHVYRVLVTGVSQWNLGWDTVTIYYIYLLSLQKEKIMPPLSPPSPPKPKT